MSKVLANKSLRISLAYKYNTNCSKRPVGKIMVKNQTEL